MSTSTLVAALERIRTDLDVECTCQFTHGPLCPKRIAAMAVSEHEKEPPLPVREDFGFAAKMLARNARLVRAVAEAMAFNPKRSLFDGETWGALGKSMQEGFEEDARAALAAVDAFKVEP